MSLKSGILPNFLCTEIHFLKMFKTHVSAVVYMQVSLEPMSDKS